MSLSADLWKILEDLKLVRTPNEEMEAKFKRADVIESPTDSFAKNIYWMLQCCMQSHPLTRAGFEFVDGKELAIDAAFSHPVWKLHRKWLSFDELHQNSYCEQQRLDDRNLFCCDHAVLGLWGQILSQLVATDAPGFSTEEEVALLKGRVGTRIVQMPRGVKCVQNRKRGELVVSWESVDSYQNRQEPIRVVLHRENCADDPKSFWKLPLNLMFNPKEGGK